MNEIAMATAPLAMLTYWSLDNPAYPKASPKKKVNPLLAGAAMIEDEDEELSEDALDGVSSDGSR